MYTYVYIVVHQIATWNISGNTELPAGRTGEPCVYERDRHAAPSSLFAGAPSWLSP